MLIGSTKINMAKPIMDSQPFKNRQLPGLRRECLTPSQN